MVRRIQTRGPCDACGKNPRVLTSIESGQQLCRTCLRRMRKPKEPNPNAPASDDLLYEASQLGIKALPNVTHGELYRMVRLARRCLPITGEFLNTDFDRLVRFQDEIISYIAAAWEQMTGSRTANPEVPGPEQQTLAALLLLKYRPLALAIQRVQKQRDRFHRDVEDEFLATHPPGTPFDWSARQPPIAEDETYAQVARMLRSQWKEFLPQRPGLLTRLLRGRQPPPDTAAVDQAEPQNDAPTRG